jgi:dTDP-4-dehydrorhamnose 3,5-epimerase
MIFTSLPLNGAIAIDPERLSDDRGFFARTYCEREFAAHDIQARFVQCNVSFNLRRGTLRGLHYQQSPHEESKLVSCPRGAIYDVIVDLRSASPTYRHWHAVELSESNGRLLYVPKGFAHGFQTLCDDTTVFYQMSEFYHPDAARGIRWDDAALAIPWPKTDLRTLSQRDLAFPVLPPMS